VADGTGPLLLHTTPTASTVGATVAGTTTASKVAVGSKLAAIGATVGGAIGVALGVAAVAGAGYLGYRLVKYVVADPQSEEPDSEGAY
jgi:hypothetical protein